MIKKGEGLFQRGERLTAAKLNEAIMPGHVTVAGAGAISRGPEGDVIQVDIPEAMYIRLTAKDTGNTPIRYAWKEVSRLANGTWLNTTRTGNTTADYAMELNNANLSTSDDYIYRAERSPSTGEWLFFLRRSATPTGPIVNVTLAFNNPANTCGGTAQLTHYSNSAWGPSVPTEYRIANATLYYINNSNVTTNVTTWNSTTDAIPTFHSFTLPYTPSNGTPLTLGYRFNMANGTALGRVGGTCLNITTCQGDVLGSPKEPDGTAAAAFYNVMNATTTACETVLTATPGANVPLVANLTVTGSITLTCTTISVPVKYHGEQAVSGYTTNVHNRFATGMDMSPLISGGALLYEASEFGVAVGGGFSVTQSYQVQLGYGYVADSNTIGVWPSATIEYTPSLASVNSFSTSGSVAGPLSGSWSASGTTSAITPITDVAPPQNGTYPSTSHTYAMYPDGYC